MRTGELYDRKQQLELGNSGAPEALRSLANQRERHTVTEVVGTSLQNAKGLLFRPELRRISYPLSVGGGLERKQGHVRSDVIHR